MRSCGWRLSLTIRWIIAGPKRGRPTPGFSIFIPSVGRSVGRSVAWSVGPSPRSNFGPYTFIKGQRDKKKSPNLLGQKKITQPLGTKKNHPTSWDGKNHPTKKSHPTSRDEKNHPTSMDEKKSANLSGQEKITQPLGTKKNHPTSQDKKKSPNLLGRKKNHPTSRDPTLTGLLNKLYKCRHW